jgi:signal transduction histidine kinase
VSNVRHLVYGIRPPALDDLGLVSAIRQQAETHAFVADVYSGDAQKQKTAEERLVGFSLEAPGDLPGLPAAVEVACYRIVQEALTNVARHAHAKTCHVRLLVDQDVDMLEVEVRDDGLGMPKDRIAGVGLSSMRERAEELGGTCDVEPDPGGGARVLARLPLPTSEQYPGGARSS